MFESGLRYIHIGHVQYFGLVFILSERICGFVYFETLFEYIACSGEVPLFIIYWCDGE